MIGKRPRDQLNLKALKYMQAVFSIKDAISKKEAREIGALFGLTVTQVPFLGIVLALRYSIFVIDNLTLNLLLIGVCESYVRLGSILPVSVLG